MTSGRRIAKRARAMQRRAISHRITVAMPSTLQPGDMLMWPSPRGKVLVRVVSTPTPTTTTASRLGARP
jgi:hypothetical protein